MVVTNPLSVRLNKHTKYGIKIMLAGFLSEKLQKTIFVLGIMMMTLAGAMEQMDSEVLVDPVQCAMNLESEIGNHG